MIYMVTHTAFSTPKLGAKQPGDTFGVKATFYNAEKAKGTTAPENWKSKLLQNAMGVTVHDHEGVPVY